MKTYRRSFKNYLDGLSRRQPSPGGGSVVCLLFCQGTSLLEKALQYSQTKKQRHLSAYIDSLSRLRRRIYPYIDKDSYIFGKIMSSKGKQRAHYLNQNQKLIVDVARACCAVFSLAKKMESDIKKNIISDFYIGCECVRVALKGCILNLEANEELFGVKEKSLNIYKRIEKQWQ